ncbi:DUF1439 domain-containing protein [Pelagicoccus mobilis]|uniref:DUF1439 domain-containing protein n=1 Tax=Pelagicoccus mobilis TaxID=415221 RepID=A0A934RVN1_9BACT|nr:DUF1439 domain-containing protein [Pelagicoccus mobilis]MBK1877316.1 DUF1439 domain-containing protein [Pelagicoccus mobilis]
MKKLLITIALLISIAGTSAYFYFKGKRYEVVITQEQIDSSLAQRFPTTKTHLVILRVNYSDPQVSLLENENRVRIGMNAKLDLKLPKQEREFGGGVTITSVIRYHPEKQEFFLDNATIERLDIQGVPDEWSERVTTFANETAIEIVEKQPVYKLKAIDAKTTLARLLLKDFEVRDQAIHITLGI